MSVELPRFFAVCLFPLETPASRTGRIVAALPSRTVLTRRMPVPVNFWFEGSTAEAAIITEVSVQKGVWQPELREVRGRGALNLDCVHGRALAARLNDGPVPVRAALILDEPPQIIDPSHSRINSWRINSVHADPPHGASWEHVCMWRI